MRTILFVLAVLACSPAFTQCSDFSWVVAGNGDERDEAHGLAVDAAGNSYFGGWFDSDTMDFGSGVKTANYLQGVNGAGDIFIAKFGPDGEPLWAVSGGGDNSDWLWGLEVGADGSVYGVGEFFSSTMFFDGGISISNPGPLSRGFIVKYNSDGVIQWARAFGTNSSGAEAVSLDSAGRVYVAGEFEGTFTHGASTLTSAGSDDLYIITFSPGGVPLYGLTAGGTGFDSGHELEIGPDGSIYAAARSFSPSLTFAGTTGFDVGLGKLVVLAWEPDGTEKWMFYADGDSGEEMRDIEMNEAGQLYMLGDFFSASLNFGGTTLTNSGEWDIILAELDPDDGSVIWVESNGGADSDNGQGLALMPDGNIFVSGSVGDGPADFGSFTLNQRGVLLLGHDPSGNVLWAESYGGSLSQFDEAWAAAVTPWGDPVFGGEFSSSSVTFDDITISKTGGISSDVFVGSRRNPLGLRVIEQSDSTQACEGDSVLLGLFAQGSGLLYQWQKDGLDIAGANSAFLLFNPVDPVDAGTYQCVVTDSCSQIVSDPILLEIIAKPVASISPDMQILCEGDDLIWNAEVTGIVDQLSWLFNGALLAGENADSLLVSGLESNDAGLYEFIAENQCGSDTVLAVADVIANPAAPSIIVIGDSIQAGGVIADSFQWFYNGAELAFTVATILSQGSGVYQVVAFNGACSGDTALLDLPSALPDFEVQSISISPNPTRDWISFHLASTQVASWELYDQLGRLISSGEMGPGQTALNPFSQASIEDGSFWIRFIQGDKVYTAPILRISSY